MSLVVKKGSKIFARVSLQLQAKLLRVLQEQKFYAVGGSKEIRSGFRLIAATHRNLAEEAKAGTFREDLFFRIAVVELKVPALRDRKEDIPLLARTFLEEFIVNDSKPQAHLAPSMLELMMGHSWPGNVRELRNALERNLKGVSSMKLRAGDKISSRFQDGATISPSCGA